MSAPGLELNVSTPERVNVSLPIAGIGFRALAYLVDAGLLFGFWLVVYFAYSLAVADPLKQALGLGTVVRVAFVLGFFATLFIYWTAMEVWLGGQTPGKRLLHIRVVRLDGSPVGVFESAVRNLLRLVDFMPMLYALGLVVMLVDQKHRRLGDLAAGTILVREEQIDLSRYQQAVAAPETVTDAPLTAPQLEVCTAYLQRFESLVPEARVTVGRRLVEKLGAGAAASEWSADQLRAWVQQRTQS